jgi:3-hydroxyacyl-CoA dehydrogenase
MKIQRAAVVGAGAMGSGIAQVLSAAGIEVLLMDVKSEFVERGLSNIKRMYDSRVKKEVLTQAEADYLFGMIKGTTNHEGFDQVDLVIEAALEEIDVKRIIFQELDRICPSRTILASNTSALSISEIASTTKRPDKVVGMHFFNPAQTMKLVEVIPGVHTSSETTERAVSLCRELNKIAVVVEECPGFLVNRLLFPYMNEALYVLQEGALSPQQIDEAVVKAGMPMGPLALFDMTGIDVCAHVNNFLYEQYGPRFEPNRLLDALVAKKQLGQKTGAGFYVHEKGKPAGKDEARQTNPELASLLKEVAANSPAAKSSKSFDAYRVLLPMFNEATYALQEKVVKPADVDVAMQWGCGMTKGLLTIAEDKGLDWCLSALESYQKELGERFRPSWLLRKLVRAGVHDFSKLGKTAVAV